MEQRLECAQPLTDTSERLIDLVDRVIKRHTATARPRWNLFSFLMRRRPLARPSLDRPSQKITESSFPSRVA